jgi:hypothetical protein
LTLLFLLKTDPFSILRLLDLLTTPAYSSLLTVPYAHFLEFTYDLLPVCPQTAFQPDLRPDPTYNDNLLLLSTPSLTTFLDLLSPDLIPLSMTLRVYLALYYLEGDI